MQNPRYWRKRAKAGGVAGVVLGLVLVALVVVDAFNRSLDDHAKSAAPPAAALVALASLIVTALSLLGTWRRQRRESTIKAWVEWSRANIEHRELVTKVFGVNNMSDDQGRALVEDLPIPGVDAQYSGQAPQVRQALVRMLNGLEQIAVGARQGVYDTETLRLLGGTIIARTHNRARPYIKWRRQTDREPLRQAKAYEALESMCDSLERRRLIDSTREIDRRRLQQLSSQS